MSENQFLALRPGDVLGHLRSKIPYEVLWEALRKIHNRWRWCYTVAPLRFNPEMPPSRCHVIAVEPSRWVFISEEPR